MTSGQDFKFIGQQVKFEGKWVRFLEYEYLTPEGQKRVRASLNFYLLMVSFGNWLKEQQDKALVMLPIFWPS
jgi:hypothetical protein